jgi:hypothetical protein
MFQTSRREVSSSFSESTIVISRTSDTTGSEHRHVMKQPIHRQRTTHLRFALQSPHILLVHSRCGQLATLNGPQTPSTMSYSLRRHPERFRSGVRNGGVLARSWWGRVKVLAMRNLMSTSRSFHTNANKSKSSSATVTSCPLANVDSTGSQCFDIMKRPRYSRSRWCDSHLPSQSQRCHLPSIFLSSTAVASLQLANFNPMGSDPGNIPKQPIYVRSRQSRRSCTIHIRFASQIPRVPLPHCDHQLATLQCPRMPCSRSFHVDSATRATFITPRPPYTPMPLSPLLVALAPDLTPTLSPPLLIMPTPHFIPSSSPLIELSRPSSFTYLPPTFPVRSLLLPPPSYNQSPGSQRTLHNIEFFAFEDKDCGQGRNRDWVLICYYGMSHTPTHTPFDTLNTRISNPSQTHYPSLLAQLTTTPLLPSSPIRLSYPTPSRLHLVLPLLYPVSLRLQDLSSGKETEVRGGHTKLSECVR